MADVVPTKTVMITGAGGQLARAVVIHFAQQGARLVLADRTQASLDRVIDALGTTLGEYVTVTGDLGQAADVDAMVTTVEARFGAIDTLVHTAGGFAMGDPVHEADIGVFEKMMYLNAQCVFVTCGRVARHMVEKGRGGSIIVVLARSGLKGAKHMGAYTASKAAAERIVQSMAAELLDANVRVNGVMPSTIDTPANRQDMPNADFSKWVTPEQIADVIGFLASDGARAISGDSIGVYHKV